MLGGSLPLRFDIGASLSDSESTTFLVVLGLLACVYISYFGKQNGV